MLEQGGTYGAINKGRARVCYSYVENLVEGLLLVGEHEKAAGETYIIADGTTTWHEFNDALARALEVEAPAASIPYWAAYPIALILELSYRLFGKKNPPPLTRYRIAVQARDLAFVAEKVEQELGYRPKVSLQEGLRRTVAWYRTP